MKISIITATYNSAATVGDTLKSISQQDYKPIEHIIVDGLSKDNTLDIVKQFPHVATMISEKDKGIYDAMNKGIKLTTGEVVGILNSDDLYSNETIVRKVMELFANPEVDAVYGDLQYVAQHDISKVVRTWRSGAYKRNKFYNGWMPPHPSFFVRKKVYDQFGDFNLTLKTAADYEIMLRFLFKNNVSAAYLPEILVKMRTGGASNASLWRRWKANREDKKAWLMNGLSPRFYTFLLKPIRKINQFLIK